MVHPPVEPGHLRPVLGDPFGAERVVVGVAIRHEDDAFRGEDLRPRQEPDPEGDEGDHDERSPARPVASIPRVHEPVGVAHPPGERKGKDAAWWTAAAAIVMAGFALRVLGARGDLWLDEVWSVELARVAGLAGAVFTQLHHDNNHHLNTLWLLALGYDAGELPLRLLAVAAGTAMVAVAALGDARDRALSLAWAFLLSFSYVAIHYGSEARGYGLALLFAVTGYVSMDRFLLTRRLAWAVAFAASAVLGLLSHLTFLYAQLAFLAWSAAVAWRDRGKRGLHAGLLVALMPPALCFAALWAVDLRFLVVGRGPEYQLWSVLRELVRTTFGIPRGPLEWLALPVLLLPAAELSRLARARDLRWVYFLTVILVGPAAVLLVSRPEYLAPRYFLLAVPFLLWLTAGGALRLARTGRTGLSVATALAVLFLAGNGTYVARLLREGRGQYREALAFIVRSEPGPVATVGSDHDFRNATVIGRLLPGLPGAARFRYVQSGEWNDDSPRWVLVHHFAEDPASRSGDPRAHGRALRPRARLSVRRPLRLGLVRLPAGAGGAVSEVSRAGDRRRTRRVEWLLFVASLLAFAWFHPGGGWNQNARFALVRALVEEGRVAVDSFLVYSADPAPGSSRLVRSPVVDGEVLRRGEPISLYWRDGEGRAIPLARRVAGQVAAVRPSDGTLGVSVADGVTFEIRAPPGAHVLRDGHPAPLASLVVGEPVLVSLAAPDGRRALAERVDAGVASTPSTWVEPGAIAASGDLSFHDGHFHPAKAPGGSFLAVPAYAAVRAVGRIAGADPDDWWNLTLGAWLTSVFSVGLLAAASVVLFFRLAMRLSGGRATASTLAALTFAFGTPFFPYATMLYEHAAIAFFLLLAFALLLGTRDLPGETGFASRGAFAAGAMAGLAAISNYVMAVVALMLLAYLLATVRRVRPGLAYLLGLLGPFLLLCAYNVAAFGTPFTTNYAFEDPQFLEKGEAFLGVFQVPDLWVILLATVSPFRGVFVAAPALLLGVAGLVPWFRDGRMRAEWVLVVSVVGFFLAFLTTFNGWHGGLGRESALPRSGPAVPLLAHGAPLRPGARRLVGRRGRLDRAQPSRRGGGPAGTGGAHADGHASTGSRPGATAR